MPEHLPRDLTAPVPARLSRRHLLVGGAAAGGVLVLAGLPTAGQAAPPIDPSTPDPAGPAPAITAPAHPEAAFTGRAFDTTLLESPNRNIMFPVFPNSATSWNRNQDTYNACRDGCSRRHQGEDLMAPKMTKLLACVSGTVVELRHRSSGNSLYIRGDDGWFYCYLHINNDRPGTDDASNLVANAWGPALRRFASGTAAMNEAAARGFRVLRGEHLAYVGDSGNAEGSGSHLHFEIRKPATGTFSSETTRLWASASVNPRESLRNAAAAAVRPQVDPAIFAPWTSAEAYVGQQFRDFLGRAASPNDVSHFAEVLNSGEYPPEWLLKVLVTSQESDDGNQSVARLYKAAFGRYPDSGGLMYWLDRRRSGWTVQRIAEYFAQSPELRTRYGALDDPAYVDRLYQNVLGRSPDAAGSAYWVDRLATGTTRGQVLSYFSQSDEHKAKLRNVMHIFAAYGAMFRRGPSAAEVDLWLPAVDDGALQGVLNFFRTSTEYRSRFAG